MIRKRFLRRKAILAMAIAAVAKAPAYAMTLNLTYTANVAGLANASAFESAINYAAQQFDEMYANPITLNFTVDTENLGTKILGTSNRGVTVNTTYSAIRTALINGETTSDQTTNVTYNWPATDPTGNNSVWGVSPADGKALGLSFSDPASDGTFTFNNVNAATAWNLDPYNRAVSGQFDLVGTAEHEFSELMGRVGLQGTLAGQHPAYMPYDLEHFTGNNVRDLPGTAGGDYFSIDDGATNLKAFNSLTANGDLTDWDNGLDINGVYVPDSFNAVSNPGQANTLSVVDGTAMDVLGYDRSSQNLTFKAGTNDFLAGFNWTSPNNSLLDPFHGASMVINNSQSTAYHYFSPGENFILASNSDMGQSMTVSAGFLELNDAGQVTGSGFGLLVNQDGSLFVSGTGQLYAQGPVSIGDAAGVTNALAEFSGGDVIVGNPAESETLYVGNAGRGELVQSGSCSVSTPSLVMGNKSGSSGVYVLEGTATLAVSGDEIIANAGSADFEQQSGLNKITGSLILAQNLGFGSASYELIGGTLDAGTIQLNSTDFNIGPTTFSQSGGIINTSTVFVNGSSTYNLSGGECSASITSQGNVTFSGGFFQGNFDNTAGAKFTYTAGIFSGGFTNDGVMNIDASLNISGGMLNQAPVSLTSGITLSTNGPGLDNQNTLNLPTGSTLTLNGSGLDNEATINISGGTINGVGTKTNNGIIEGTGTISGTGALINDGSISESFGPIVLGLSGNPYSNNDAITLEPTFGELDINTPNSPTSDRLINAGSIAINGAVIDGSGGLENASGGTLGGTGKINTAYFTNDAGATVAVGSGTLTIVPTYTNAGTISLPSGGILTNTGGMTRNTGTMSLTGGVFNNNGVIFSNNGLITGYGIIDAGGMTNGGHLGDGTIALSGGSSIINTPVSNVGTITITSATANFLNDLTGAGIIQVTNSTVTVAGNFNTFVYTSSNSSNTFKGNVITIPNAAGMMTGGASDQFFMSGGTFTNNSTFTNTGLLQTSEPITNNGTFTQTGTFNQNANFTNNATATIGGSQTWAADTTFNNTAGIATFQTDAGSTASTLTVNATGGTVVFASPQHLADLSVTSSGQVDIENNHIIINYGTGPDPIASIAQWIAEGYSNGTWTGLGIMSTAAQGNAAIYGIGYADAADPGNPANLPDGEIEIKYTLLGDANLDGKVNGTDFAILATNFNQSVAGWDQGDFNYDNKANGSDFAFIATNFNQGASQAALDAFAAANGLMADVPEPAATSLTIIVGIGMLARRKRSNRRVILK